MRGYPIGTFMFWNLKKKSINDELIKIYEFIKDVNEDEELVNPDYILSTNNEVCGNRPFFAAMLVDGLRVAFPI